MDEKVYRATWLIQKDKKPTKQLRLSVRRG